mmetsp:Transcript_40749/g.113258  ORF Transcript_40749/g.113258 Transcript_40749/m.113258 type:complete len:341 (-) Transcript_40749:809-1831(-)
MLQLLHCVLDGLFTSPHLLHSHRDGVKSGLALDELARLPPSVKQSTSAVAPSARGASLSSARAPPLVAALASDSPSGAAAPSPDLDSALCTPPTAGVSAACPAWLASALASAAAPQPGGTNWATDSASSMASPPATSAIPLDSSASSAKLSAMLRAGLGNEGISWHSGSSAGGGSIGAAVCFPSLAGLWLNSEYEEDSPSTSISVLGTMATSGSSRSMASLPPPACSCASRALRLPPSAPRWRRRPTRDLRRRRPPSCCLFCSRERLLLWRDRSFAGVVGRHGHCVTSFSDLPGHWTGSGSWVASSACFRIASVSGGTGSFIISAAAARALASFGFRWHW